MAVKMGTAANHAALWNILLDFLQNDPTLVADNENWELVWTAPSGQAKDGIVLKGPGAAGLDAILIGLSREDSEQADRNRFWIRGIQSVLAGAATVDLHMNCSGRIGMWTDQNPMKYWIVASGRRFVLVCQMSTVYQCMYGGFFLPYANPLAYTYPLMVGGTMPDMTGYNSDYMPTSWRSQAQYHHAFPLSHYGEYISDIPPKQKSSCYMMDPQAQWLPCNGINNSGPVQIAPYQYHEADENNNTMWDMHYGSSSGQYTLGYMFNWERLEENVGGGYSLSPISLIQTDPSIQNYGVMDGVFAVPGQNNAAENILQMDGVDYLVVQDVFRTEVQKYFAVRLS